ncbi:MAG: murein biosynthesis integral membrane protein MurJ [Sphaerobacteraceae bacterium]|nr:MAG: murein biosynthesis integral membrane protein MurJ [Sphaerobacteraceae bacterium]
MNVNSDDDQQQSPSARLTTRSVAVNAGIVAAAFIVSRILGLLREVLIASQFGTSPEYDAYVAAFRIPDLLFLVVMSGAFGSAFIPVFGGFIGRREYAKAWALASTVLTYTVVVLLIVAQIIFFFAGPIIGTLIAPGLGPEQQELAVNLTRMLLLSPLLLGLGAAAKGMLEAQDSFTLPAIAPILYNVGIIFGAVVLAPEYGAYGLAYGVIVGAAAHATVQFVDLALRGWSFRPSFNYRTEGLGTVTRLMAPRIIGQAAFQVNIIVMTNFGSRLGDSRVSALNYAYQLFMLPHGVLALSLSTVIFPLMARQFELGQHQEMKQTLTRALGPLIFLTFPAAIGLIVFRESIVQMILQFGTFSAESTQLVATALAYFAIGLIAFAVVEAITRAFYAMQDTLTPVIAAVLTVAANIGLSWLLAPILGHGGLALSISITTSIEAAVLLFVLYRRIGGLGSPLLLSVLRTSAAAVVMTIVALLIAGPVAEATDPGDGRSIWSIGLFLFALATAGATYLCAAWYLRAPELIMLIERISSRIPGRARG